MLLPGGDQAFIEDANVRDYLLLPAHPVGRFKARFFVSIGYTQSNWKTLRELLLQVARSAPADLGETTPYGQKYEVRATNFGPAQKSTSVVIVRIVLANEECFRFVTAYPA